MTIAAGSSRRAMAPPAPRLVTTAISPRRGRAWRMPMLRTANPIAVFSAIGMNRRTPIREMAL